MILDSIIVAAALACAVAYLVWSFLPHSRPSTSPCAACPKRPGSGAEMKMTR